MSANHRRKPYMPDSDNGKRDWMERFISQLEKDPQRYGFNDPRMFESYRQRIRAFIKAVDAVANPGTCTPGAVKDKNNARKEAVRLCRDFAMQLKWDSSLTNQEKSALGIITDQAPAEKAMLPRGEVLRGALDLPTLAVQSSPGGGHVIRYMTSLGAAAKAKPKGVSHLLLFGAIGEKPNMRRTHARLLGAYSKRPFEIMYPLDCGLEGLYVTYYGRWLTVRGEMSPWSRPVSKIIGEGQVSLRDCQFAHLFGKEGFVDALPQGAKRGVIEIDESRPLLESDQSKGISGDGLLAVLEAATVRLLNAA
jgi:hypothetical protein